MATAVARVTLSIAEVAAATELSAHTLRYYERAGLIASVTRAGSGHRRYDETQLRWIGVLKRLRATGMGISEMRRYAELVRAGEGNEAQRLELLLAHRDRVCAQLAEVSEHLEFIEQKVAQYAQRSGT